MDDHSVGGKIVAISRYFRANCWWMLPLLLGVLARAEYLREFSHSPLFSFALGADVSEYDQRAREILGGVIFPLKPEIHAPLYSFFLAGVYRLFPGDPIPVARLIQLLLALPASFLLADELRRCGMKRSLCGWFLAGMVLLPNLIYFQAELVSESLLFSELALALGCLLRFWRTGKTASGVLCGIASGLAVLTHGFALCFLAAVTIAALCRKQWKHLVPILGGALLIILPFPAVKSVHYGRLTGVQANGAFNLWLGNNPEAKGYCYIPPGKKWRSLHREAALEAQERQVSSDRVWLEKTLRFWKEHPWKALVLFGKKAVCFFSPNELPSGADPGILVCRTDLVLWGRCVIPAVFLLAILGFADFIRRRRDAFLPAVLLVGAFWIGTTLTVTSGRYRMGAWPGLLVLAVLGIGALNWKRWWSLPLLAIMLTLPFSFSFMAAGRPEAAALLGEAALRRGNPELASDLLAFAARKLKDPAQTSNLQGGIAARRGDLLQAEKWYREAAEEEPEHPAAWMNLGVLYGETNRHAEAIPCFEKAMPLGEDPALAAYNYGLFRLRRRELNEAERLERIAVRYAPWDPKMWNALGIICFAKGDFREAERAFRRAADLAPEHPGYAQNAEAARRQGL